MWSERVIPQMGEDTGISNSHPVTFVNLNVKGTLAGCGRPNRGRTMLPSSEVLSRLVGSVYDAAADPTFWSPFLEQLAYDTRATSAALVMHDFDHAVCTVSSSWELNPEADRLYQEYYHVVDVWAQRALPKPAGYVCSSESLCLPPEIRTTEIYNDFLARFGIEHGMFSVIENTPSLFASASLYRDQSSPEFETSGLETLRFLSPHLQRAFKLHFQFSELKAQSACLEAALDLISTGVILFGSSGKVLFMNCSASALVGERDGLLATREGLRSERQGESALLTKAIQGAAAPSKGNGVGQGGTVLISRRVRCPLQVMISPLRNSAISRLGAITAIAFVMDPSRRQRPTQDILRTLFGLTPAECRVALLLGDGLAPKEIAGMIGVSVETVRSQMKSIFSKTNVKRQSELVRVLLNNSALAIQMNPAL
jgi:DNA-binding CsgD family transcriptional regulator